MKGIVSNYFNMTRMPTGRLQHALKQINKSAEQQALVGVLSATDRALTQGKLTLRVEFSYEQTRDNKSVARGKARQIDNQLDAQIGGIESVVSGRTIGDEGDPVAEAAKRIMEVIFPRGVAPIIHQSFEIQLGIMKVMLETFDGDLSNEVQLLGLDREVQRMGRLVDAFEKELDTAEADVVTYDQVLEARELLHEYASIVVAQSIAAYPTLDEQATREREALLAPLNDQQERVASDYKRRRRVTDIDPETGEELLEDDGPLVEDESPSDVDSPIDNLDEDDDIVTGP